MNKFNWYDALSLEDAVQKLNATVGEELYNPSGNAVIIKSGGIDLLDLVKESLIEPHTILNIKNIPGLDKIVMTDKSLKIGANCTLAELEENSDIKKYFPAFHDAIAHAATPQLRNMSTIGGNLAQRTRCWYFRSADHPCFRKGGDICYARQSSSGQNENHAILDNESCVSVHSSSIATALVAYDAKILIHGANNIKKEVGIDSFFLSPSEDISNENILAAKDILTNIVLTLPAESTKSYYHKQVQRESYDWSIGDVAIVAEMEDNKCKSARMVLGSAAPVPFRVKEAEMFLANKKLNKKNAEKAAELAMKDAQPLSKNNYKVPLFKSIIVNGLLNLS